MLGALLLCVGAHGVHFIASSVKAQGQAIANRYEIAGVECIVGSSERTQFLLSLGENVEPVYDAERAYIRGDFNSERTVWPFCTEGGRAQAAWSRDRRDASWRAICQYASHLHEQPAMRSAREAVANARRAAIETRWRAIDDRAEELQSRLDGLTAWDADAVDRLLRDVSDLEVPEEYVSTGRYDEWGREIGEGRRAISDVFPGLVDPDPHVQRLKSDARGRLLQLLRDEVARDLAASELPFDDRMMAASDAMTQASRMGLFHDRETVESLLLAIGRRGSELVEQSFGTIQGQAMALRWSDEPAVLRRVAFSLAGMTLLFQDEHDAQREAELRPALDHARSERRRSADVSAAVFELCFEIPRIQAAMRENSRANSRVDRRSGTVDLAERRTLAEDAEDLRASERNAKATLRAAGIPQAQACRDYRPTEGAAGADDRQESRLQDVAMRLEATILDA